MILEVMNGVYDGAVYKFSSFPVMIGRAHESQVSIPLETAASRNHAQILSDGDQAYIADSNSTNGTFVNDTRVFDRKDLASGDVIKIGGMLLVCDFSFKPKAAAETFS